MTTSTPALKLFIVNLIARQSEYENYIHRLVRAESVQAAEEYLRETGLPEFYAEYSEDAMSYGEVDDYNQNQFFYNCGDRAIVLRSVEEVPADKVQAVEIASSLGLCDFI